METQNKEQVYDEQINPLMAQIIAICNEHGIAVFCDFEIPTPENPDLVCTTILPDGEGKHSPEHRMMIAFKRSTTDFGTQAQAPDNPA